MVSGQKRGFELTWEGLSTHLIGHLAAADVLVETVICLDEELDPDPERASTILERLKVVHFSVVAQLNLRQKGRSFGGFQRQNECFRRALQRELDTVPALLVSVTSEYTDALQDGQHAQSGALRHATPHVPGVSRQPFDFFVHARPDLAWLGAFPMQALSGFNAVLMRAQRLLNNQTTWWLSEQAQAAYLMGCAGFARGCSFLSDDQFAVVPRQFAPSYFAEHLFFDPSMPNRTMHEREAQRFLLQDNMMRFYRPRRVPPAPRHAQCSLTQGSDEKTRSLPSGAFGAEGNLAFRLALRRVPTVVHAFPVHLSAVRTRTTPSGSIESFLVPRWWQQSAAWPNASRSCKFANPAEWLKHGQ